MGKTNSTFVRPLWMASLFALALFLMPALVNAQCQDNVVVTLDGSCEFVLTIAAAEAGTSGASSIIVDDSDPTNLGTIDGIGTYPFGLVSTGTGPGGTDELICWGTVTAEDKTAPIITCPSADSVECFLVDEVLNNSNSLSSTAGNIYTGEPTGTDNCNLVSGYDWADQVEYFTCDENPDTTGIIHRRFTIRDAGGLSASCVQDIAILRIKATDFAFVATTDFVMVDSIWTLTEQTCSADATDRPDTKYPTYQGTARDGNTYTLGDVSCELSTEEEYIQFQGVCEDGSYKEERELKVFDWCAGEVTASFEYVVKVGDFEGPDAVGACVAPIDSFVTIAILVDSLNSQTSATSDVASESCGMISTGPMNCTAAINTSLSALESRFGDLIDDCGDIDISVDIISYIPETIGKIPTGDTIWVEGDYARSGDMFMGLPVGFHAIVINATDNCYNSSDFIIIFEVMDLVKPVMKCDDELRVTLVEGDEKLGVSGYALVTVEDVDEGSWDNCGLVDMQIRREITDADAIADWEAKNGSLEGATYTPWDEIVEFFCADLGAADGVEVQLWGTDVKGNTSICWLDVEVENGTNVGLVLNGSDQTITCEDYKDIYFDAIATAGAEIVADGGLGCSTPSAELSVVEVIDQCGFGTITISIDASSVSADDSKNIRFIDTRTITIDVVPRYDYWIEFPADDAYFCEDEGAAGVVLDQDVACDLLTVYENDEIFYSVADPDACYKIFRTYRVINWCEYDGESAPYIVQRSYGYDPGSQDVYVVVDVNENDPALDDRVVSSTNSVDTADVLATIGTGITVDDREGYYQYTQHIIVYDDSAPEVTVDVDAASLQSIDNDDCDADVEFTITITDACSTTGVSDVNNALASVGDTDIALTEVSNDGSTAVFTGTIANAPLGEHTLRVTIDDGCGNVTVVDTKLEVVDAKGPAPICHDGIVVELMPTEDGAGMAEVWAIDLIASPIEDCTALSNDASGRGVIADDAYSIFLNDGFTSYDDAVAGSSDPAGLFFSCADAGTEPMVRVYAEDEAGNVDYCLTFVRVQDNNSICATAAGGSIAGAVATETASNVEGVEVQLSGARSMMYMTDASGSFGFDGLAQGGDYTVTPQKDLNHLNGVSTFDLVLISKHILGVSQLDSPYKMIAADVNNSQSITTLDLIQLRKLILNIDTEFANNTSWRFIDKSHVFADPSNPWATAIPEFKNINNLGNNAEAEFVATKIGDVNGSATVEARAATGEFAINTAEQAMVAGNEYTIDFSADMNDIAGYQFTLDVANAEIVDVIYGAAKAENFGVFTKEGVITTSYNGEAAGTLFSVVVRATADTKVSEAIQISSRYTAAEAYTNDAEQLDVNLNVAGATAAEAAFALNQNTPNPFQGETQIGFNLPEAQEATITLQDVAGRTVKMIEGDFAKGYNQVTISANDFPSAGVYFYTLTAGDKSATKKLILVDALNR